LEKYLLLISLIAEQYISPTYKNYSPIDFKKGFKVQLKPFLMLAHNLFIYQLYMNNLFMRSKFTLSTTITTVIVIVLVLAALTFMDNNTARNTYASIILLCCLFVFVIALSLRRPSGKIKESTYKAG